jgi:HSP20 family protein
MSNIAGALKVSETEKHITVKTDVPGFETKDVHVRVEKGFLLIYGKKGYQHKTEHKNTYSYEATHREFSHCLPVPKNADAKKLTSGVKNGILEIVIPKKA